MKMMKVLFFDLDGTLYIGGRISRACREELLRVKKEGNLLILNTGRSLGFLPEEIRNEALFDGMICGSVYAILRGEILMNRSLPSEVLKTVARWGRKTGNCTVFEGMYENFSINGTLRDAGDLFERPDGVCPPISKVTMWCEPESVRQEDFPGLRILHFPTYAEGILEGFDKSTGMRLILSKLGLDARDAIAFGDSENDRDMLLFAGKAVCMPGAPKDFDDFCVYRAQNADGVPEALKRLFPRREDRVKT